MYVQLCMCLCDPYFDLFPHCLGLKLFMCVCVCSLCAFVLVCVCVWRRSVSVAPVISLLLPAPTPVLQLTCIVLGPTRSYRPATAFYPFFPLLSSFFSHSHSQPPAPFLHASPRISTSAQPSLSHSLLLCTSLLPIA